MTVGQATLTPSSVEFKVATTAQRGWGLALAIVLGYSLSQSLIPTIHSFSPFLSSSHLPSFMNGEWLEMLFFPLICGIFYLSLPRNKKTFTLPQWRHHEWLATLPLALIIALIFGLLRHYYFGVRMLSPSRDLLWYVLLIPLGEEWLFRGWIFQLNERIFPNCYLSLTNPLPMSLWLSSTAFALWHLQNATLSNPAFMLFQLLYTFCTGLWLGYLRWKTGKITTPIMTHLLINLAAILPLWLC